MTDDVDRIMAVMAVAFAHAFGEAWSRRQVEDALTLGNCHYGLVAEHGGVPVDDEPAAGFFMSRTGYEEEELLLIGVDPTLRRRGLGEFMMMRLRDEASSRGAQRLLLEMRRGNPAESLYRRLGFYSIGERREYYRTPGGERLDAITFALNIVPTKIA